MLLDRTHRRWLLATSVAFALLLAVYLICCRFIRGGPSGGSVVGLLFGVAGTSMMVFAAMLGGRRKGRTWPFRTAQTWMRGHLWIGLLSVPTILFHANLQAGGLLENLLWWCLGFVILSGIFGLLMQQILPRAIATSVNVEVSIARQPVSRVLMAVEAETEIARVCGPFKVTSDPQAFEIDSSDPVIDSLKVGFTEGEKGSRWYDALSGAKRDHTVSIMRFVTNEWEPKPAELDSIYSGLRDDSRSRKSAAAAGAARQTSSRSRRDAAKVEATTTQLSPLEQMRQKKSPDTVGTTQTSAPELLNQGEFETAEAAPGLSPLEQMRQTTSPPPADASRVSPLDLLQQRDIGKTEEAAPASTPLERLKGKAATAADSQKQIEETGEAGGSDDLHGAIQKAGNAKPLLEDLKFLIRQCARAACTGAWKEQAAATASEKANTPLTSRQKETLQSFYLTRIRPFLLSGSGFRPVSLRQNDRAENLNDVHLANRVFDRMTADLSTDCEPVLNRLREIVTTCRDLNRQVRMHGWLHAWLAVHIPATVVLFVLIFAHAIMALRVIPVSL